LYSPGSFWRKKKEASVYPLNHPRGLLGEGELTLDTAELEGYEPHFTAFIDLLGFAEASTGETH
jgi:hypothetical protein